MQDYIVKGALVCLTQVFSSNYVLRTSLLKRLVLQICLLAQVTDLYIFFSVKGHVDKHKAHTVTSQGSFSWNEHTIEIEIPDPIHASLEVGLWSAAGLSVSA